MRKKLAVFVFLLGIAIVTFLAVLPLKYSAPPDISPMPSPSASPMPPTSMGIVDEIVSNLEWGNIAFDTPRKMKLEEPKTIELLLSPTKSVQELRYKRGG